MNSRAERELNSRAERDLASMEEMDTRNEETNGEERAEAAPNAGEEKTFTQAELDEVLKKRLAREREKMSLIAKGEFEQQLLARERAVTEKEYRAIARERLSQAGLPVGAAEFINCESEEAFESSYQKMALMLGPMLEEAVEMRVVARFRKGGSTPHRGGSEGAPRQDAVRNAFKLKE